MIHPARLLLCGLLASLVACVEDSPPTNEAEGDADVVADAAAPDVGVPVDAEVVVDAAPAEPDMAMTCEGDGDCGPGGACVDGVCQPPECRMDQDCPAPMLQACREFICRDRCLGDRCVRGGICIDGACMPEECVVDGDCEDDFLCREGRCVEPSPCAENVDCEPDGRCIEGNCEPLTVCAGDANCADDEICQGGLCRPQPGCEARADCSDGEDCVAGRCVPFVCRGVGDCPEGEICRAGTCEVPEAEAVAEVVILTRPRSMTVGERLRFRAVGLDLRGDVVAVSGFEWAAMGAGVIDAAGSLTAGPEAGEAQIVAAYAGADGRVESAPVTVPVVALDPVMGHRVRVTDAHTGAPVEGATVRVAEAAVVTGPEGVAAFEADGAYTLSVFAEGYDYVTLVGIDLADLRLPLWPRSGNARVAGFTGTPDFDQVEQAGEVELGLAGATLTGGLTHIGLGALLGQIFQAPVAAGPLNFDLPLPGGLTLAAQVPILGLVNIKDTYFVTGDAGFQFAWAFAGRIDFNTLLALFGGGGGGGGFNVGEVLASLLPFFERFNHGLRVDELAALPRLPDEDDVDGDGDLEELVPDYERFPVLNVEPGIAQRLRMRVTVADPGAVEGEGTAVALLLAGADIDGVGFVPLGISSTDEAGAVSMRQAAPYGGLEVGEPVVLALAARFGGGGFLPDALSGRLARFDGPLPAEIELGTFLPLPGAARWNPALRQVDGGVVEGAGVHRAVFAGPAGRWVVWFAGAPVLTMPFPPDGAADLAAAAAVRVEALALDADLADLLGPGAGDLTDVDRHTRAFSRTLAEEE